MSQAKAEETIGEVICEARFFDVDLTDAAPPALESLQVAEDLSRRLKDLQMLVLGGHALQDKDLFARHLAWHLRKQLGKEIAVKQWNPELSVHNVRDALRQFTEPAILLFPGLQPHHFGRDLCVLHDSACERKIFVIVATETKASDWTNVEATQDPLWHNLLPEDVYSARFLEAQLRRQLADLKLAWPFSLPVGEAARRLGSPKKIRTFSRLLRTEGSAPGEDWIAARLEQVTDVTRAIDLWFSQLEGRYQSLALGLALLDGLFRDQVLAALEILVADAWGPRDSSLKPFDSCDLPVVGAYFEGTEEGAKAPVACLSREHRKAVIQAAWRYRERHVLSALPVLAKLAAASAAFNSEQVLPNSAGNTPNGEARNAEIHENLVYVTPGKFSRQIGRELFGSQDRIQILRRSIAEALSEIGRISLDAVEGILLELAAHQHIAVQSVAAASLAMWRDRDPNDTSSHQEEKLFKTMERWWENALELEALGVTTRQEFSSSTPVRATVALALSYAALYDRRGALAGRLYDLFERLSSDLVCVKHRNFQQQTLPWVVALHLVQVEELLKNLACQPFLIRSIGYGISFSCAIDPQRTIPVLSRWYEEGMDERQPPKGKISAESRRLFAATLAFGWIAAEGHGAAHLSRSDAYFKLKRAYKRGGKTLRNVVVEALKISLWRNLKETEFFLHNSLAWLDQEGRSAFPGEFAYRHSVQRRELPGADEIRVLAGEAPERLWVRRRRSLTDVEVALLRWITEKTSTKGRKIASQALCLLASGTAETTERRRRAEVERALNSDPQPSGPVHLDPNPLPAGALAALVNTFFCRASSLIWVGNRHAVQSLLEELVTTWPSLVAKDCGGLVAAVLDRYSEIQEVDQLKRRLIISARVFRFRWLLLGTLTASGLMAVVAAA